MWLEVISTAFLVLFVVGFVWLGFAFLRKKRKERIELLTEELQKLPVPADNAAEFLDVKPQALPKVSIRPLSVALKATRQGFLARLMHAFSGHQGALDEMFAELEAILFSADIGVGTAQKLLDTVQLGLKSGELTDSDSVKMALQNEIRRILYSVSHKPLQLQSNSPTVVMFVGVNGVGKTTTIGKMAHQLKEQGKTVVMGAGDTFRAAASEQLSVWAERVGAPVVSGGANADPASVLFEAVQKAKSENLDVVLCDTAGRLHTKVNLMDELKKVHRVLAKACEGAPHEVLLVLDATMGQNAIMQAKQFSEATPLTGIVLTKLDGTAKGGVVIGIINELGIPLRYIGVGESVNDLRPFDADAFVKALFEEEKEVRKSVAEEVHRVA